MPLPKPLTSETINLLRDRVSVRKYADKPVSTNLIDTILEAAFRSPTSSNIQAYSVVVIRDRSVLNKLPVVTDNQTRVAKTSVFLAFFPDLTRIQVAMIMNAERLWGTVWSVGWSLLLTQR